MFTRIVECYVKKEKKQDFTEKMQNVVLPILQSQPGFVDLMALSSEDEPERVASISLWRSRADAERYHRAHYDEIVAFVTREPSGTYTAPNGKVCTYRIRASK